MSDYKEDLRSKLAIAQQRLKEAQEQVTHLEAQLAEPVSVALSAQVNQDHTARSTNVTDYVRMTEELAHQANFASENRYHQLLDNLLEGAEIFDFNWRYLYVNAAAASHGRQTKDMLLSHTVFELYPGFEQSTLFPYLRTCMEERIPQHFENDFVFPDGTVAWFELSVQPIPEGIFILSLEITERKRAEAALRQYAKRMEILHQIDLGIIRGGSIPALVETTLKQIRRLIPCQRANVRVIEQPTGDSLIFTANLNSDVPLGEGVRVPALAAVFEGLDATNPSRIIDDFRPLAELSPQATQIVSDGLFSGLQVLLLHQEQPIGSLGLLANSPNFFTAEHQDIAIEIAGQLSIAVKQLQLDEAIERHTTELAQKVATRTADLSAAKERIEAMFNNSVDGILLTTNELAIQQTNSAFQRLFTCMPDAYFGASLTTLFEDTQADTIARLAQAVIADQVGQSVEARARRRDGTPFDAELSMSAIKGDGLVCTVRDITERKKQEQQLRLHGSLQENVSDAVIATDIQFRIQTWNKAAERIYGWRAEEVLGTVSADLMKTEFSSPEQRETGIRALQEIGWWQDEVIQYHRDGSPRYILGSVTLVKDDNGIPFGVVAINRDVTERKKAEKLMREQHEFLQQVINNVPGLIMVKDREGRFQLVNDRQAEIHDSTPEAMLGKTETDFTANPTELDLAAQNDRDLLETGQTIFIPEEKVLERYYQTSKVPLKNRDGKYDRLLIVSSDITERTRAEEALRRAFEKEKELGELKSRFVTMASHEFRTPLATILAVTESLGNYRAKMTEAVIDQRLDKIRDQVDHLRDIMEDVLQVGRLQAGRAEFAQASLDLDALCQEIIAEFQERPEQAQRLEYTCHGRLPALKLDKKLMRQVIMNLISNALKYSAEGTRVAIDLQQTSESVILSVRDEGIGIPDADMRYLFEPFHRASNVGAIRGTGLGLTITKESVELHGGTIEVASKIGKGTTFIVTFPLDAQT